MATAIWKVTLPICLGVIDPNSLYAVLVDPVIKDFLGGKKQRLVC